MKIKCTIEQNNNGDWDFDVSQLNINFDIDGIHFNPDKRTKELELSTINQLQDVFDKPGWELKNATNGIYSNGTLLVEHHQHKKVEDELVESGILVSNAGYWLFSIDKIGFIILSREFLLWCYNWNLKTKMIKDKPIESQSGWNTGHALIIRYEDLAYLFKKYIEEMT